MTNLNFSRLSAQQVAELNAAFNCSPDNGPLSPSAVAELNRLFLCDSGSDYIEDVQYGPQRVSRSHEKRQLSERMIAELNEGFDCSINDEE